MAGGIRRGFEGRRQSLVFAEFAYRTSEKSPQEADGTGPGDQEEGGSGGRKRVGLEPSRAATRMAKERGRAGLRKAPYV